MISELVARVLRAVVKLTLLAFGLVVMLGLLLLALAALMVALLRYVFTGRKPVALTAFTAFTQFRQASQQFRRGGQSGSGMGQAARAGSVDRVTDVVDVQAREVGVPAGSENAIRTPQPQIQGPKT